MLSYAEASVYDQSDALVAHDTSRFTIDVPKFLE